MLFFRLVLAKTKPAAAVLPSANAGFACMEDREVGIHIKCQEKEFASGIRWLASLIAWLLYQPIVNCI